MSIPTRCHNCNKTYSAKDTAAGKRILCPAGHPMEVPNAPESAPGRSWFVLLGMGMMAALGLFVLLVLVGGGAFLIIRARSKPTESKRLAEAPPQQNNSSGEPAHEQIKPDVVPDKSNKPVREPVIGSQPSTEPKDPGTATVGPVETKPVENKPGSVAQVDPPSSGGLKSAIMIRDKLTIPLPPLPKDAPPPPEVWDGHTNHIRGVAFTDDGKYVVSVSGDLYNVGEKGRKPDFSIRVWDPRTGKQLRKAVEFKEPLSGFSVSPGGQYAVFGYGGHWEGEKYFDAKDHRVRMWDIDKNKEVVLGQPLEKEWKPQGIGEPRFQGLGSSVFCSSFAPDRGTVVGADNNSTVIMWNTESGKQMGRASVNSEPFVDEFLGTMGLKVTPDGRYLFLICDRTLRLVDFATGRQLMCLKSHQDRVWGIAVTNTKAGQLLGLSGGGSRQRVDGTGFDPGAKDYAIRLWELPQGKEVRRFSGHEAPVMALAFCPNGRHFVSGGMDQTVRLWDLETGKVLRELGKQNDTVRCVSVSPDGRAVVSGGDDCKLHFYPLPATAQDLAKALDNNYLKAFRECAKDFDTMGPDIRLAFPALVKALSSAEDEVRKRSGELLLQYKDFTAFTATEAPALGRLLDRSLDVELRRFAAAALARLGREASAATATLTDGLNDPDAQVRHDVAHTLAEIGPAAKPAVAALSARLRTETEIEVIAELARALGQIHVVTKDVVEALEAKATHTNVAIRLQVIQALLNFGPEGARVSALFRFMGDDSQDIRQSVDKALTARFKTPTADDLHGAIDALKDGDAKVRRQASRALGLSGPAAKEAAPTLSALVRTEKETAVVAEAAHSLGLLRNDSKEVLDALGAKANHTDAAVRLAVLQSFVALQGERLTLRFLFGFAEDSDRKINQQADAALTERLKHVTEADATDLRQGLKSKSPTTQRAAAEGLGRLGKAAETAADDLAHLMDSSVPLVRMEAAIALVRVNPTHADAVKKAGPNLVDAFGLQADEDPTGAEWTGRCERARKAVLTLGRPAARSLVDAVSVGGQFAKSKRTDSLSRIEVYRTLEKMGADAKSEAVRLAEAVRRESNREVQVTAKQALDAVNNAR